MSLVDNVRSRIKECQSSKDKAEKDLVRLTERRDGAMERLKSEFSVGSVDEGNKKLEEIRKEIESGNEQLGDVKGVLDGIMGISESGG